MTALRGPARTVAELALVVALAASCGSGGLDASAKVAWSRQVTQQPSATATPTTSPARPPGLVVQSELPLDPSQGRGHELDGMFRLEMPSLDVSAPVVPVASNGDRVLLPPRDPTIVGWWQQGAEPGAAVGSAILVAHTVHSGGGVFDDVDELTTGDPVAVEAPTGRLAYRIHSVEVLTKGELARRAEVLFDQNVPGRLVIVTCEDWDGSTFRSNVVAVARPA